MDPTERRKTASSELKGGADLRGQKPCPPKQPASPLASGFLFPTMLGWKRQHRNPPPSQWTAARFPPQREKERERARTHKNGATNSNESLQSREKALPMPKGGGQGKASWISKVALKLPSEEAREGPPRRGQPSPSASCCLLWHLPTRGVRATLSGAASRLFPPTAPTDLLLLSRSPPVASRFPAACKSQTTSELLQHQPLP